jgi:hypothetical protein
VYLLVYHAYINECTVQEAEFPVKARQAALRGGIYSSVKELRGSLNSALGKSLCTSKTLSLIERNTVSKS